MNEYLILENPEQTGSWNHIPGDGEGKNMKTIIYEKNIKDEKILNLFRDACKEHKYFISTQKEDFGWDHDLTIKEVRQFVLSLGETAIYDKEFDTLYHFYREII